ncbi:uncharacterized protein [Asterias amurensis]|uniref:uncharacterized protein isoform X1 n=1 Tax=Asterias amurensis TaxID=7602 RepID=UPI003AB2A32E
MFGIRAVLLLSLVTNVFVNGYQDEGKLDGELEVLLKRLQERLKDEERGYELQDLFERRIGMGISGISVDPDVVEKYVAFKKNNPATYKWITLKIDQSRKLIVIDKTDIRRGRDENEAQFNEMKSQLTSEPRYILFLFQFMKNGEGRDAIALIGWIPDSTRSKLKLLYSMSVEAIIEKCEGINFTFEVDDETDLDYKTILAKIARNKPNTGQS